MLQISEKNISRLSKKLTSLLSYAMPVSENFVQYTKFAFLDGKYKEFNGIFYNLVVGKRRPSQIIDCQKWLFEFY